MRIHAARVVVIAGLLLPACDGSTETEAPTPVPAPSTVASQAPAADSAAMHMGHETSPDSVASSGAAHTGHAAARPAAGGGADAAHATHTASPAVAAHAAHAAPGRATAESPHADHAAVRTATDTAHAGHAMMQAPDTAHAGHAMMQTTDTAHAGHAMMQPRDTAHAAHAAPAAEAHAGHAVDADSAAAPMQDMAHAMWMRPLGGGWTAMGMAQAFPIVSTSPGAAEGSSLDVTEIYLTQPAVMFNIESPGSRFTVRTTLNFEGLAQEDGEITFGGWGEGFLDRRHPHTLLHEFMLSANLWDVAGGNVSVSAGKGFAPYGTDDPMSRPAVKYPTNHHLSQILERWTVNGAYINSGWSVEAGLFGGGEPEGPYDFSNIESFGDSWSARVARRFGTGYGPMAATELSASFGRVREVHHEEAVITKLYNAALRHERAYPFGSLYGLVEGSVSEPEDDDGYFSLLGEAQLQTGRHRPYYRVEYASRPEYEREGAPGTDGFFRYDHDAHAIGATRWLINTAGYGYDLTGYPVSARPFVELQHSRVRPDRGGITPEDLFGRESFWGVSAGFRIFLGGDPMRMGSYGVLDPMTAMHRGDAVPATDEHTGHE